MLPPEKPYSLITTSPRGQAPGGPALGDQPDLRDIFAVGDGVIITEAKKVKI